MVTELNERLARAEVQIKNQQEEIRRLVDLQSQMVRFVAAQEERNRRAENQRADQHDDRWQVWLRWLVNPGIPIGLLLAIWMQISGGAQP